MGEYLCQLFISSTFIQNLQRTKKLNSERINTPMKKWTHELNREFLKEEIKMASKYMKKSTFPVIKRCKSKLHSKFISPQLEWPYLRAITTNAGKAATK
jgi:hypothetical protein